MAEPPEKVDINERLAELGHPKQASRSNTEEIQRVKVMRIESLSVGGLIQEERNLLNGRKRK